MLRVPRQVLVYLYRRRPDGTLEFLLLRRTDEWGGFWQGVTGAPEWDESDEAGAVREVREETGFTVSVYPIDFRYEIRPQANDLAAWQRMYGPDVARVPEEVYVAAALGDSQPKLNPREHVEYCWCRLDEALGLLAWSDNRDALAAAAKALDS